MKVTLEVPNQVAKEFNQIAKDAGYRNGVHYLREFIRGRIYEARMAKRNAASEIAAELEKLMPSEEPEE